MASERKRAVRQERIARIEEVAIRLRVEPLEEGSYLATSVDVPGLVAEGRGVTEAVEIAQGLGRKILESCLEQWRSLAAGIRQDSSRVHDFIVPLAIP